MLTLRTVRKVKKHLHLTPSHHLSPHRKEPFYIAPKPFQVRSVINAEVFCASLSALIRWGNSNSGKHRTIEINLSSNIALDGLRLRGIVVQS